MMSYDVIVIGAGVVGSAVARELSRYQLKTAVLEKELDVACGNSSRNTGMLHAGFTYKPGSLKAECAVEGNQEFDHAVAEPIHIDLIHQRALAPLRHMKSRNQAERVRRRILCQPDPVVKTDVLAPGHLKYIRKCFRSQSQRTAVIIKTGV